MKRVKATMHTSRDWRTDESTNIVIQYLQEKRRFLGISYWKTIDTETVPSYAWIQKNSLGSTDWRSKWHEMPDVEWK